MIYFVRPVGQTGPVKIGYSREPLQRLHGLQCGSPVPLEMVAEMRGSASDEWRIQRDLIDFHLHGEWFRPCRRIDILIALHAIKPIHARLAKLSPRKYSAPLWEVPVWRSRINRRAAERSF